LRRKEVPMRVEKNRNIGVLIAALKVDPSEIVAEVES
jgi:hypothetical protein